GCRLYAAGGRRARPSFPTRRSSDLAAELGHARLEGYPGAGRGLLENHAEHLAVEGLARAAGSVLGLEGDGPLDNSLELGGGEVLDRKSTRLNSSHGKSSYAVFRSKK